jgi:hypothetical protein
MTTHHELVAICQTPDSFPSHSAPPHSRSIKHGSKDCWHLVEAVGSATWPISHCIFNREWVEKRPTSNFPLPGWISSQVFACHMSSVILTDIIQTVLETSECFLSKYTKYMHILASMAEWKEVYSGHLIHSSYSILPPSHQEDKGALVENQMAEW